MSTHKFMLALLRWYKKEARQLPWRETKDPYKIWISEVMLQQTTVNAVIPYYVKWIKRYPDIRKLAKAKTQEVLKCWQGLGYYQRAKNLHKAAQIIIKKFNGIFPRDKEILQSLPGFGPYTVGAVLSIAFNQKQPIVDANIRRVVMRLLAIPGTADPKNDRRITEYVEQHFPRKDISSYNQAFMELGALVCRNKAPLCNQCPVSFCCRAYKKGIAEIIPSPKKRVLKTVNAVIALIERNGKYLIQKRPSHGLLADLWEFPGGKIRPRESAQAALRRELREELNCELRTSQKVFNLKHFYTQFCVNLNVYKSDLCDFPKTTALKRWVPANRLRQYPMPSGSAKIVEYITQKNA